MTDESVIQIRWKDGSLTTHASLKQAWLEFEFNEDADKLSFPFCGTRLILRRDENCISGLRAEVWQSEKFGLKRLGYEEFPPDEE